MTNESKLLHKVIHSTADRLRAHQRLADDGPQAPTIIHNDALLTLCLSKKELFCYPSFKPLDGPSGR
jgi:hypothetical protein